jgi:hypothetical protein
MGKIAMNEIVKIPAQSEIDYPRTMDNQPVKTTQIKIDNQSGTVNNSVNYIQNIYYSTGGDRQSVQFSEGFKFLVVSGFLVLLVYVIWLGFLRGSEL